MCPAITIYNMDLFKLQMDNVTNQEMVPQFSRFTCHGCETSFPNVEFLHEHVSILHEGKYIHISTETIERD